MADSVIENRELFPILRAIEVLASFPGEAYHPENVATIRQRDRAMHDLITHYEREETSAGDRWHILAALERQMYLKDVRPGIRRRLQNAPTLWVEGSKIQRFFSEQDRRRDDQKRRRELRNRHRFSKVLP